ncbi:unnamed protein product [Durusdinium trenchii]|uniref:Amine oxidase domain-containing protein n=1 Tax=Durusdinium trenchii TaxID=1381693 RepID=A0ABP0RII8_9DINO
MEPGAKRKTTKRETSPVAERARVLVIGAGISGLAAAREVLQLPNVDVTVLEARKRLGGRVHTDRFSDGTVIDLGAQWLHGVCPEHPIARLAKEHPEWGELWEMDWDSCPDFELGSSREICPEWLQECEEHFEHTWELYESRRKEQLEAKSFDQEEKDVSLWDALRELRSTRHLWSGLSERQQLMLRWRWARETEWVYAASLEALSSRWWDDDQEFDGPDCMWPEKGFQGFIDWLSEGVDLRLNCPVTAIIQDEEDPRVLVHCASDHPEATVEIADLVIVTLPLGVLKTGKVEFVPPFSAQKEASVQAVGVGLLNKVALHFRERFWPPEMVGFDRVPLSSLTDLEPHEWVFHPECAGAPVAIAFFCWETARQMEELSDKELTDRLLRILSETFDQALPELEASLVDVKRSGWQGDDFACGSYSFLPCGVKPLHRQRLQEPHGPRVFFAGEHCRNDFPSTVHGAYLSGLQAAKEVAERRGCMNSYEDGHRLRGTWR